MERRNHPYARPGRPGPSPIGSRRPLKGIGGSGPPVPGGITPVLPPSPLPNPAAMPWAMPQILPLSPSPASGRGRPMRPPPSEPLLTPVRGGGGGGGPRSGLLGPPPEPFLPPVRPDGRAGLMGPPPDFGAGRPRFGPMDGPPTGFEGDDGLWGGPPPLPRPGYGGRPAGGPGGPGGPGVMLPPPPPLGPRIEHDGPHPAGGPHAGPHAGPHPGPPMGPHGGAHGGPHAGPHGGPQAGPRPMRPPPPPMEHGGPRGRQAPRCCGKQESPRCSPA